MLAGPDGLDPKIGSGCNATLGSEFRSANNLPMKGLRTEKSRSQAVASLGEDGEMRTDFSESSPSDISAMERFLNNLCS